jgi:hypothetical protein
VLTLILSLIIVSGEIAFSQPSLKRAIFLELGGNAYHYSINYERHWARSIIGRIGAGYLDHTFVVPVTIGKIYGSKAHHFELAGGLAFAKRVERKSYATIAREYIAITAFIGYRYQKPDKKFFMKAGFTPLWEVYESNYYVDLLSRPLYPWGGIGLGSRF